MQQLLVVGAVEALELDVELVLLQHMLALLFGDFLARRRLAPQAGLGADQAVLAELLLCVEARDLEDLVSGLQQAALRVSQLLQLLDAFDQLQLLVQRVHLFLSHFVKLS